MLKSFRSASVLFVLLAVSVLFVGCDNSDKQSGSDKTSIIRPVKTATIESTKLLLQRKYSGVVLPSQEADLSFRVSGRIIDLPIRNGKKVKRGDVIAQLDTRDFKANITLIQSQLVQALEKLDELKAGARDEDIAALQADVAAAKAQVDSTISQVSRTQELFNKGIIAKSKLDQDVTSQRVAEATLEAKQQALIKGRSGARKEDLAAQEAAIRGVESQLETAKHNLSDATLRAPFDGTIATRKVENFSNIQAKENVATLQKLTILDMIFDVPAPDVAKLAKTQEFKLQVAFESIPGQLFTATRNEFSTQADTATQTYRGRVTIEELNGVAILPGMTGTIFVTAKLGGASTIMLPLVAIATTADGKPFVWIVDPTSNTISKRDLKTGEASDDAIVVFDGLADGDVVVTAGLTALQDGMEVKILSATGE